eukprot:6180930-Pleurochrysis_carterae.AAC.2
MHKREESRWGGGGKKEGGCMESNIGIEPGRYREYIYGLRTFCEWALDDYDYLGRRVKPQKWVPQES